MKRLKIIDKAPFKNEEIEFYNKIFSVEQNHWNKKMNRSFDNLFFEIILGN